MKSILTVLTAVLFAVPSQADESAIAHCKKHLLSVLSQDLKGLETTYGDNIHLMPGHEFAKPEYKLGKEDSRKTGLVVTKDALLNAMKTEIGDKPPRPKEMIEKKLSGLEYVLVTSEAGGIDVEASDPVGTEDGKLHFNLEQGDLLYKITPPRGDFVLLHLRKVADKWVVVSEYLD